MSNESPLLPSPNTTQKPVNPNESANWRMSEGSLQLKRYDKRLASKGEPAPLRGRKHFYAISHSYPKLKLRGMVAGGLTDYI
jgi:hypothetical protein